VRKQTSKPSGDLPSLYLDDAEIQARVDERYGDAPEQENMRQYGREYSKTLNKQDGIQIEFEMTC
jgi:hypothetical protein